MPPRPAHLSKRSSGSGAGALASALVFPVGVLVCGVVTLAHSAEELLRALAAVARRARVDEALVALLTAGAEWEELAIVIASLIQHRPALALGNILGSALANIGIGFSLGLLSLPRSRLPRVFSHSARVYTRVQFVLTLLVALVLGAFLGVAPAVPKSWTRALQGKQQILGGVLIAIFVAYVGITARAIYRGALDAPEDSDADSDSDSAGSDADSDEDARSAHSFVPPGLAAAASGVNANPTTPLLARVRARPRVSIFSHIARLLFSLLLLCLSSFVVSRAVSQLGDLLRLGDTLAGLTLLSLATTLPEALLGLVAGKLGRIDVLAAAAAGANIFLLGGCLGVVLVFPTPAYPSDVPGELLAMRGGHISAGAVHARDLLALLIGSGLLMAIVHTRASRAFGAVLLAAYAAYLVCEIAVWSRGVAH